VGIGHFAETDEWVSVAGAKKLKRVLGAAGKSFIFHSYPGTTHWFFEKDRVESFHPEAAELAWSRTLEFLNEALELTHHSSGRAKARR